jgi:hypothetical protein
MTEITQAELGNELGSWPPTAKGMEVDVALRIAERYAAGRPGALRRRQLDGD